MRLRRIVAASLTALLALLAPGPEAWAAAIKAGGFIPGRAPPAGRIVVVPASFSAGITALSSRAGLDPGDRPPIAVPGAKASAIGAALPAAPAIAALPESPAAPPAAAGKTGEIAAEEARDPRAKTAALLDSAAPLLREIAKTGASPGGLRESGAALQDALQGVSRRPAASDAVAEPAASRHGLTASLRPAAAPQAAKKASPQPDDGLPAHAKSKFRLYAFGVSAVKTGLDALNLAVPLFLLGASHSAMTVSALYFVTELARLISGTLCGSVIDHVGAGRALTLTTLLQIAATASLPFILTYGGVWAMPMVFGAFALNGVGYELFDVARRAALPQIVGKDEGVLRAQNGRLYVWREIAATAGVFGAGWVVKTLGAVNTAWAHPAFCFVAALAMLRLWNLRPQANPGQPTALERMTPRAWRANLLDGMRRVLKDSKLRSLVLINIPLTAVHKLFHTVVAVVYAAQVLHNPAFAAVMVGAWNLGELAGAFYLDRRGKKSHFSNWLRLAAAASLAMWTFYLIPAAWAAVAASFLIAAAMIGNELGAASYMQSKVPEKNLGSVTGFVYGLSRAVGMLALLGAGWSFDALAAQGGFLVLALIFTVLAPVYLLTAKRFASDHISSDAAAADRDG